MGQIANQMALELFLKIKERKKEKTGAIFPRKQWKCVTMVGYNVMSEGKNKRLRSRHLFFSSH